MPITQVMNSKANVKKQTSQDLPFSPQQPVIASYYATSTLNQTSIANLGFSIDQSNTDIFWLFVDGKKLNLGSDYSFANIDANNTSSAITLLQPLAINLPIQAYKLGLKKESEFLTDNRFTTAYEYLSQAFQGFVVPGSLVAVNGSPGAGQFRSDIAGRASVPDFTNSLAVNLGVNRIVTQTFLEVQSEIGPSSQRVWGVPNDPSNQIRFVGNWTIPTNTIDGNGAGVKTTGNWTDPNDYIEIVFYGTGLNILLWERSGTLTTDIVLDGTSSGSAVLGGQATVLDGRNYAQNIVVNIKASLTPALHTIKLIGKVGNTAAIECYGFEILNETSALSINAGSAYVQGKKSTLASVTSSAFASSFTNVYGTAGARGGRVLVYLASDGTIKKDIQYVNTAQANLTSADHTNEEMIRQYYWREFGAGRTDGFDRQIGGAASKAFTLDDGTTTLVGSSVQDDLSGDNVGTSVNGGFLTLTFVGTGLDIVVVPSGTTDTHSVSIDGGASIGNISGSVTPIIKIVSGLPYGTHTVRITRTATGNSALLISKFRVYAPKKPALPSGSVELADYYLMATFVANQTSGLETMSTGVLRKQGVREMVLVNSGGGWGIRSSPAPTTDINGFLLFTNSTHTNNYFEYTFFGTGFDYRWFGSTAETTDARITIDGVALNTTNFTISHNGGGPSGTGPAVSTTISSNAGASFTPATGVLDEGPTVQASGMSFTLNGLTLGKHTVRVTNNANAEMSLDAFDIITPIHAPKSPANEYQNTSLIGSCALSDNRKLTPIKDAEIVPKAWAQAFGITADPSTTSTSFVPVPDMSVTVKTNGGALEISYSMVVAVSVSDQYAKAQIYVDGLPVGFQREAYNFATNGGPNLVADTMIIPIGAGVHKVDLYWRTPTATLSGRSTERDLTVREI